MWLCYRLSKKLSLSLQTSSYAVISNTVIYRQTSQSYLISIHKYIIISFEIYSEAEAWMNSLLVVWQHAATPPHNKLRRNLTECLNINITLARLNCKLSEDGRRPKHVGAI